MAVREVRYCDLTGDGDAKLIRFSVDGVTWEIDLCDVGEKQLGEALRPFVDVARRVQAVPEHEVAVGNGGAVTATDPGDPGVGTVTVRRGPALPAPALTPEQRRACRAWAQRFPRKAGADVGNTGALAAAVVDRWIVAGRPGLE